MMLEGAERGSKTANQNLQKHNLRKMCRIM
jgi:hypothetical protein